MNKLLLFVLFGPLLFWNHEITSNTGNIADLMSTLEKTYLNIRKVQAKNTFINKYIINNLLPNGLKLSLNLALGVNDPNLVNRIENILELASSRIVETLQFYLQNEETVLDEELDRIKQETEDQIGRRNFTRGFIQIKRNVGWEKQTIDAKLNKKLGYLKTENAGPENFIKSGGSRKLRAKFYRKGKGCNCSLDSDPAPYVKGLRSHSRNRVSNIDRQKRRRVQAKQRQKE